MPDLVANLFNTPGLPIPEGYDVARRLRAEPNGRKLVMALIGTGQEEEPHLTNKVGFNEDPLKLLRWTLCSPCSDSSENLSGHRCRSCYEIDKTA